LGPAPGAYYAGAAGARHGRVGVDCTDLGYADDFCLLSTSTAGLQRLLDCTHGFLSSVGKEVSAKRPRVQVFGPRTTAGSAAKQRAPSEWTCGGADLELVPKYKYLGVEISSAWGTGAAIGRLQRTMTATWAAVRRKYGRVQLGL